MPSTTESVRGLPSVWTAVRHHPWLILLALLLASAAAGAYATLTPRLYTATTVLLLNPLTGNPLSTETASASANQLTVAMETEAGLVGTPEIAGRVATELGRPVPGDAERVRAVVPGGTQVLEISFTSGTAARAQEGAQAYGEAYLAFREEEAQAAVDGRLARLEEQADQADAGLRRAVTEAAGDDGFAVQEVQIYADRLAELNAAIAETSSLGTDAGRVLNPAQLPTSSSGLPAPLVWAAGVLGGLALGLVLAVLREWRRDLVREDEEIDVCGLAVFARIPEDSPAGVPPEGDEGRPQDREAYRRLRAAVTANTRPPHVLAVTGIGATNASTVTANLAAALTRADFSVLAISANPDSRQLEELLGADATTGLSDAVLDRIDPGSLVTTGSGVAVLGGGADPARARELYGGPALRRVVESCGTRHDYVLLDTAGTGTADGDAVVATADAVLLTVFRGRTTHGQVRAALDRFDQLNVQVLGVVNAPSSLSRGALPRGEVTTERTYGSDRAQRDSDEVLS